MLSPGTDRCFQLVRVVALSWYVPSLPPGMESCLQLVWSVALSWYGSLLSAGTRRCPQLVQVSASSWNGVLLSAGMRRCSQLVRIVVLRSYGSWVSAHTAHCVQLEQSATFSCWRLVFGELGASVLAPGGSFRTSGALWGTILAPRDHPGEPREQDGREVVLNRIFITFAVFLEHYFERFWAPRFEIPYFCWACF